MTAITATPLLDATPMPRVNLAVAGCAGASATIWRVSDGRTWAVRGAVKLAAAGIPVHAVDMEVPFGLPCTYQVQEFDEYGNSIGYTAATGPVLLDVADTWVHQPLNPLLCARVQISGDSAAQITRGFDGSTVWPDGATAGVWVGTRRHGVQGVQLTLETYRKDNLDALQAAFGDYTTDQLAVLCIRAPAGLLHLPGTLFLSTPAPTEADISYRYGGQVAQLQITGDEVRPPAPGLVAPLVTYSSLDAGFLSYAARDAHYGYYSVQDGDYARVVQSS